MKNEKMKYIYALMGRHFVMARQPERAAQSKVGDKLAPQSSTKRSSGFFSVCLLRGKQQGRGGWSWRHELSINLPATNQRDVQLMWQARKREREKQRATPTCTQHCLCHRRFPSPSHSPSLPSATLHAALRAPQLFAAAAAASENI